ncbi:MAG: TonB-dependent receptor, partial [Shewanella sp.]
AYAGGSLNQDDSLLGRISVQTHQQDGFMENSYLGRDDTNKRDETSVKAKLRWYINDDLQADLTLLHGNFDNGYDVWSLDSNGTYTHTDQPGVDTQTTNGAALKLSWQADPRFSIESISSFTDTKQRHAYDGDWSNSEYWQQLECAVYDDGGTFIGMAPCVYDSWWDKTAKRQNFSQDVRILSDDAGRIFAGTTDWLFGLYFNRLTEDNLLGEEYNGWDSSWLSNYEALKLSAFGQLDTYINKFHYSVGLRIEQWQADYSDSNDEVYSPDATLFGGHISVGYQISDEQQLYAKVARGYKAGGFNVGLDLATYPELSDYIGYEAETLYNYEIGHSGNWLNGDMNTRVSLFFMDRQDQQVDASIQVFNIE